jgi:hypothetical protein
MIKMISPSIFLYLAADRENTNLAIMRSAVAKHVASFR